MLDKSSQKIESFVKQAGKVLQKKRGQCPDEEELTSYHLRELEEARAGNIRAHLALCSECVTKLKEAIEFFEVAEQAPVSVGAADEALFKKVLQSVGMETKPVTETPVHKPKRKLPAFSLMIQGFLETLMARPAVSFATPVIAIILVGGGLQWYALTQKPEHWQRPRYQALINLASDVNRNAQPTRAGNLLESAKENLRLGEYSVARTTLKKYIDSLLVEGNKGQLEAGTRLLGLTYLLSCRRSFIIDFYFDKDDIDRAIETFQTARELAEETKNVYAQEELHWLLGKAYVMLGDLDKAAEQFRAILQMAAPGLTKRQDAEQALADLEALTASQSTPAR